jgi:serine phosphatase RsbU (regulator of sigma subunit)
MPAAEMVREVHAAVREFAKGVPQADDIALLVLRRPQ